MPDLITYCQDTTVLVAELQEKLPNRITFDGGKPVFLVPKTPTVRNGLETLALLRLTNAEVEELNAANLVSLTVLGTYDAVFADPDKQAIYDRVYPHAPYEVTDESGTYMVTPPMYFGVFA